MGKPTPLAHAGREKLDGAWIEVGEVDLAAGQLDDLDRSIDAIFAGKEKGYRAAIIIQLAGKAADFSLDAQAMQKGSTSAASWDAREFAKQAFVPWNASIGSPLGHSADPYVSNQFRNSRFDSSIRGKRKSIDQFDNMLAILESANATSSPEQVDRLLIRVLLGLRRWMQGQRVAYPIPQRASLEGVLEAVHRFLAYRSGGARLQAVAHALFACLERAGLAIDGLGSRHVNASDASAAAPGDIGFTMQGNARAIEIKDRPLTEPEITASVNKVRVAGVTELIFVVNRPSNELFGSEDDGRAAVEIARTQFNSGINVHWVPFLKLANITLMILGEAGRRDFLKLVGEALEEQRVDVSHRSAWATIVAQM
jgi:SacI restriction endonuclease